jgi:hypothetical protein
MRTQRRRFVTIAAVVLGLAVTTVVLAFYVVRVVEGVRRAAEDSRRVEQRYVEQWLAEQKKGLYSSRGWRVCRAKVSRRLVSRTHRLVPLELLRLQLELRRRGIGLDLGG